MHRASFDVEWQATMDHFSFGTNVSPRLTAKAIALEPFSREFFDELKASHQEHYEQFGVTAGSLTVRDGAWAGEHPVLGHGMRDRAFGLRRWGYMQRYIS